MRTRANDREAPAVRRRATWNSAVLAESDNVVTVEGNTYFPPDALDMRHFRESRAHSLCPWKGLASYYDVVVDGVVDPQAAWYYPHPTPFARRIKGRVAFWNDVRVETVVAAEPQGHLKGGDDVADL
jgi:uncharacterized protein (DUF427 family)